VGQRNHAEVLVLIWSKPMTHGKNKTLSLNKFLL
jgi:hypothetical protein